MNLKEIQVLSSENLRQTYFELGLAIPTAQRVEENGFQACTGEFEHPICNFAVGLNLDPSTTQGLVRFVSGRKGFNVYALPGDEPEYLGELLRRARFKISYRLVQMVAEPRPYDRECTVRRVITQEGRLDTTRFMTEQFFPRQTDDFRKRVAEATAAAENLELYEFMDSYQRVGAVMLCMSPSVVGIYNLCIASNKRGNGFGRHLTSWALSAAQARGELVTLQCDARLAPWYESLGFCQTGIVEVYTLSKSSGSDIMKGS